MYNLLFVISNNVKFKMRNNNIILFLLDETWNSESWKMLQNACEIIDTPNRAYT